MSHHMKNPDLSDVNGMVLISLEKLIIHVRDNMNNDRAVVSGTLSYSTMHA